MGTESFDKRLYRLPVPGHRRHDLSRTVHDLPVQPAHEAMERELEAHPEIMENFERAKTNGDLPPAFWRHPVVQASGGDALPVALYVDAVPYSRHDS
eukprot:13443383-Alexandrium_andersonii.AAC.1